MGEGNNSMLPLLPPGEIEQLKAVQRVYEDGLRPTPDETVARFVGALATAYPSHKISPGEAKAKTKLYVRGLHDIPQDALSKGFEDVMKTCTFFPSIAEIRQAAASHFEQRRIALLACRRLISKHEREYIAPDDDEPLQPDQVPDANRLMRRLGLATRYRPDGTEFQLAAGDADPCEPDPIPEDQPERQTA